MSNRNMVNPEDAFMDEALGEELTGTVNNSNLSESEVREIQAGLNLMQATFPQVINDQIKVDGIMGPKTYAALKGFINLLPEETQANLSRVVDPIVDFDSTF